MYFLLALDLGIVISILSLFTNKLTRFLLATQDDDTGGFADAGLSLLGNREVKPVNPIYSLPQCYKENRTKLRMFCIHMSIITGIKHE